MRSMLGALLAVSVVQGQTVSVYLPEYNDGDWEALRGSVISSDKTATAFTVFCAQAPACQIAGDLPFVFTQGAETLMFTGIAAGQITADLHCKLDGQTAAVCTGSTTFGHNFHEGSVSGPTQVAWTSTLSGSDVEWGVLTLATPGPQPGTTDIEGTVATGATEVELSDGAPTSPSESGADGRRVGKCWPAIWAGAMAIGVVLW